VLDLLDKFIIEKEIEKNEHRDLFKKQAYLGIKERQENNLENLPLGIIAEKTVKSFLARVSKDHPGLEFEILPTNAYQDVEMKVDILIVSKNKKQRGVKVGLQEEKDPEEIVQRKIQFTINKDPNVLERKQKQLGVTGEVILIQMPGEEVRKAFAKWKENKHKEISNPDQYLDKEMQIDILKNMLKDFVKTEELENKINNAILG